MNSRIVFAGTLLAGLCASASVPTVSNVTTTQSAMRKVTVNYTLSGEAGIVTLTAQTNRGDGVWIDVDDANLTFVSGDVNKVVEPGNRSLVWQAHKSWPDQFITGGKIRIGVKAWSKSSPPDYMVVSLEVPNVVLFYPSAGAIPGGVQDDKYKTDYLVLRKIPAAGVTWRMGSLSAPAELGRNTDEKSHLVTLTNDYYIGVYPVTQRQYKLITTWEWQPSYFTADSQMRPVEQVSYEDLRGAGSDWPSKGHAVSQSYFFGLLRSKAGLDGFDLPTEAQWEFAARAGCGTAFYNGTDLEPNAKDAKGNPTNNGQSPNLAQLGRYHFNGGQRDENGNSITLSPDLPATYGTAKVGSYLPNAWGLYDMLGNVGEWCLDWYQASLDGVDPETGPQTGTKRVKRGGGFGSFASYCRCASRSSQGTTSSDRVKTTGFRVACPAEIR